MILSEINHLPRIANNFYHLQKLVSRIENEHFFFLNNFFFNYNKDIVFIDKKKKKKNFQYELIF